MASRRFQLLASAVVLLAVVALPASAASPDTENRITVTAQGSVRTVPDRSEWTFGVFNTGKSAKATLGANSTAAAKVIAAVKRSGVSDEDVTTEQVSLSPRSDGSGSVTGYAASNSVHVTINLEAAGGVIDAAVAAGANQVYGPGLSRAESDKLYDQALAAAFDRAREKALALAQKAGLALGQPVAISEQGAPVPYIVQAGVVAGTPPSTAGPPPPIQAGTREVTATITVTFATS